jgi:hypothetical protein
MRRVLSIVFLVLGGWLLMGEPLIAFMDLGAGAQPAMPFVLLGVLVFAAVPLAIGAALSPGKRRRELGLTILIATGAAVFSGISLAAVLADPGFRQFMPLLPPMPKIVLAPVSGALNLVVLTAIGWWLYRGSWLNEAEQR